MNHQTETDMDYAIHHWSKRLLESRKPAYLLIPDLIEEDLATGRLKPRDRLPGLRDLAGALNLNYTTVARAVCGLADAACSIRGQAAERSCAARHGRSSYPAGAASR
jgi:DNA-binding transcriptional MocR family regulator